MITIERGFDVLLGGLKSGHITQIYGAPASGKTNLALIATNSALRNGRVIYIDSEGGFSIERLKQISGDDPNKFLRNVMLIEPTEFDEQKVAIRKLNDIVPNSNVKLIVVDSMGALYRLEENRDIRELGRLFAQLLRISRRYNVPVLVTNQVYTDIETGRIIPVGSDVTRYWSKIIIELKIDYEENTRIAIIRRHKFLPEGLRIEFRIIDSGIEIINSDIMNEIEIYSQK